MGRLTTRFSSFQGEQLNWDIPSNFGKTITPGASNAMGSWVDLFGATLTDDCYGLFLDFANGQGSGTDTLADIGVDTSGGTSYSVKVPTLMCGYALSNGSVDAPGHSYYFPLFFPAGSRLACRAQQNLGTVVSFQVRARALQKPSHPELLKCGDYVDAVGVTTASSAGKTITPGLNLAWGAWTLLGSPSRGGFFVQSGVHINESAAKNYLIEYALGDGTNFRTLTPVQWIGTNSSGGLSEEWIPTAMRYATVPAGQNLYARVQCGASSSAAFSAAAYVVGGFGRS